jgi:hypothetical protein
MFAWRERGNNEPICQYSVNLIDGLLLASRKAALSQQRSKKRLLLAPKRKIRKAQPAASHRKKWG